MSELTPRRATVSPVRNPMSGGRSAMAARMATGHGTLTPKMPQTMNPAANIWVKLWIGPTEKSNSPQTSGMMMASARMPTMAWLPSTFWMLSIVRNVLRVLPHVLKKANTTTNSTGTA